MFDTTSAHESATLDTPSDLARCAPVRSRHEDIVLHAELMEASDGSLYIGGADAMPVVQAVSCLVRAQPGDRVRALLDEGTWVITDILHRPDTASPLLIDGGDRAMKVQAGHIELHARDGLRLIGRVMHVAANVADWVFDRLRTVAGSTHLSARTAHRQIEQIDSLKAAHIVQHASQTLALRGRVGTLQADALLKIDGAQVHMG